MDKNILIVGLLETKVHSLAQALADKLSMIHLNIDQLIDYQLVNKHSLAKAGRDYFDAVQSSCVRQATECIDTVASVSPEVYLYDNYTQILSVLHVIFIDFDENEILSNIDTLPQERQLEAKNRLAVHNELTKTMTQLANIVVPFTDDKTTLDQILIRLGQ